MKCPRRRRAYSPSSRPEKHRCRQKLRLWPAAPRTPNRRHHELVAMDVEVVVGRRFLERTRRTEMPTSASYTLLMLGVVMRIESARLGSGFLDVARLAHHFDDIFVATDHVMPRFIQNEARPRRRARRRAAAERCDPVHRPRRIRWRGTEQHLAPPAEPRSRCDGSRCPRPATARSSIETFDGRPHAIVRSAGEAGDGPPLAGVVACCPPSFESW